jgi:DNA mismatch endonuclease (patch repair protein)
MVDTLTPEQRRKAMQLVKTKDGPLEHAVRSALHRKGYRFRKHLKSLPGKPDIVFTRQKVAIFVDGDFWHGYHFNKWRDKMGPYWQNKIEGNIARDKKNFSTLRRRGWIVVRLWGHQVKKDLPACIERIESALNRAALEGQNAITTLPSRPKSKSRPLSDRTSRH